MAREIRAPERVMGTADSARLVADARDIAGIVARHVLECVMRVVGHLCATGGTQKDANRGRI